MDKKNNLLWIDLEMTGLDHASDEILEIASLVTDSDLNIIAHGPSLTIHQPDSVLDNMDAWCKEQHTQSGLCESVRKSRINVAQAEQETLAFIRHYCAPGLSPLCGNSVWKDKLFLEKYMPTVAAFVHYRVIDVSTIKSLVTRWYSHATSAVFVKPETHRAAEDIIQSVYELRHYKERFFKSQDLV